MKQVLDRIFKEITGLRRVVKNDEDAEWNRAIYQCEEIVYKHMDDVPDADVFRWIPVEERLPEKDGFYLVTMDGEIAGEDKPFTGLTEFENGKWLDDEDDYQCVLAWQPLPEPYRLKKEIEETK